jgi:anti-sigma factor RsiW
MEIDKIKEILPDYVQGLLSGEDSAAVKELLDSSEALRREYEQLRSYHNAINTLKP